MGFSVTPSRRKVVVLWRVCLLLFRSSLGQSCDRDCTILYQAGMGLTEWSYNNSQPVFVGASSRGRQTYKHKW